MNNKRLIDEFLYIMEHGYSRDAKTIKAYRTALEEMQQYMFNGKDVTLEDLKNVYADDYLIKWLKVKQNEGVKASTLNQRISCIRSLYKWLIGRGELNLDVSKSIPMFKNNTHETKEVLTKDECWKLLDIAEEEVRKNENYNTLRDLLICKLFLGCGLRISEVAGLNISCFDLDNMQLNLSDTKFNKFRTVTIPTEVIYTFTKFLAYRNDKYSHLDESMYDVLLISKKFNRLSDDQIRLDVYRLVKLCNFDKKITPHSLRHTYGTLLLESGNSLEEVAKEMGHSSINTLVNYYYHKTTKTNNPIFDREKEIKKDKKDKVKVVKNDTNVIQIRFA